MGNCVEKEEIDAPADFQPKARQTSPYLTTPITFLIGPKKARYTVPRAFLSESPQWSSLHALDSKYWDYQDCLPRIALPEVNEDAGHTLVHYLYTGTFQKLLSPEDDDLTADLKITVHLYGVAVRYGLAGLKGLALEKIQNKEGLGDIFDILETIKEASKTLLKDDLGLKPYIKRELKAAFEIDDTFFGKERFIELFGEAKQFDRILMRIVADIYSEKIAQISQNTPAVINGSPLEAIFTTGTSSPCSPLLEEPAKEEYEKPVVYGELYEYEKPLCEDPFTFKDHVDQLDISEEYPVQTRFSTLEKEPYKDLAVSKVNISKKYTCNFLKRVPTIEKETRGKSEEPILESDPWDCFLPLSQDPSGGPLPIHTQGPPEDDFPPGVSKELEELEDQNFSAPSPPCGDPVPHNEPASPFEVERSFGGKINSCEVVNFVYEQFSWGEAVSRAEAVTLEKAALCEEDTPAGPVSIEEAALPVPCEEAAPVELDLPSEKVKKGKKGKKMKTNYNPEIEAVPLESDVPIRGVKKGKKEKRMKTNYDSEIEATPFVEEAAPCTEMVAIEEAPPVVEEAAPCTEVVPSEEAPPVVEESAPCTEVVPSEEAAPVVEEPAPCIEVPPSEEAAPIESDLTSGNVKKGKKGKKMKTNYDSEIKATPVVEEPAPCPEVAPSEEAAPGKLGWPTGKAKKAKKVKKTKPPVPDPVPGPSASGENVDEKPAPIAEEPRTENGVDLRQHPDESSICASRATHLLVDDEWKKCVKCRALILHLSLELARNMNEDQHGYEII